MRKPIAIASVLLASLILAACSSQPPAPEQSAAAVEDRQPGPVAVDGTQVAPVEAGSPIGEYSLAQLKDPRSILSKRSVYFDFDQYVIKDEFKSLLEAHGRFLNVNQQIKVLIQGNADERGSREYNLALGQKRAEAVKKSLLLLGGKEDQVEAVSLGEEKPRCTEQSEECWAENRRADMLYTGEF
ncbi:putative peptidoglycan-associated lipoprotein [Sterolibacterium denitrificans]|uniref:Peptidoglycan-associated lipoprotein n=1 Tax=Sterolibacterium denitrificans TaxID=157592 RepID=A0A7Z7MTS6_9PROT|nr:peptidoglycan-associated lipoprotein Pal [Sterolibacterium denitrificans]SMB20985.1 putative peptidoglycan-associated lipoprotein [Sterolibacterium denitrificans]